MANADLEIRGYFCITKEYPPLDRLMLNREAYKESVRRFDAGDLEVLEGYECLWGSMMCNIEVVAVVDTGAEGSLIPFFIDKKKLVTLQDYISKAKNSAIVSL